MDNKWDDLLEDLRERQRKLGVSIAIIETQKEIYEKINKVEMGKEIKEKLNFAPPYKAYSSLCNLVRIILSKSNKPLAPFQIAEEALKMGYQTITSGSKFNMAIYKCLVNNPNFKGEKLPKDRCISWQLIK